MLFKNVTHLKDEQNILLIKKKRFATNCFTLFCWQIIRSYFDENCRLICALIMWHHDVYIHHATYSVGMLTNSLANPTLYVFKDSDCCYRPRLSDRHTVKHKSLQMYTGV